MDTVTAVQGVPQIKWKRLAYNIKPERRGEKEGGTKDPEKEEDREQEGNFRGKVNSEENY